MNADARTEGEIIAGLRDFFDAFEKRDMERVLSCFAPDPDVVMIGTGADEKRVGLQEIRTQIARDWGQSESASLELGWTSVSASGSVAWVASDLTFHARVKGKPIMMPGRLTAVLEKRGERWLLTHSHLSVPSEGQAEGESFPAEQGGVMEDAMKRQGAFSWNELMTTDPVAAVKFYSELLGWTTQVFPMEGMEYTVVKAGDREVGGIMGMPPGAEGVSPHWGAYITVDNVDATAKKAEELGARIIVPPMDIPKVGRFCTLSDPQGAVISIITYVPME